MGVVCCRCRCQSCHVCNLTMSKGRPSGAAAQKQALQTISSYRTEGMCAEDSANSPQMHSGPGTIQSHMVQSLQQTCACSWNSCCWAACLAAAAAALAEARRALNSPHSSEAPARAEQALLLASSSSCCSKVHASVHYIVLDYTTVFILYTYTV